MATFFGRAIIVTTYRSIVLCTFTIQYTSYCSYCSTGISRYNSSKPEADECLQYNAALRPASDHEAGTYTAQHRSAQRIGGQTLANPIDVLVYTMQRTSEIMVVAMTIRCTSQTTIHGVEVGLIRPLGICLRIRIWMCGCDVAEGLAT
jgi:hypothetical protein